MAKKYKVYKPKYKNGGDTDPPGGKKDKVLYVTNPNDPRLRAYSDSLNLYTQQNLYNQQFLSNFPSVPDPTGIPAEFPDIIELLKTSAERAGNPVTSAKDRAAYTKGAVDIWNQLNKAGEDRFIVTSPGTRAGFENEFSTYSDLLKNREELMKRVGVTNPSVLRAGTFTPNSAANWLNTRDWPHKENIIKRRSSLGDDFSVNVIDPYTIYAKEDTGGILADEKGISTYVTHGLPHKEILHKKIKPVGSVKYHAALHVPRVDRRTGETYIDPHGGLGARGTSMNVVDPESTLPGYEAANFYNIELPFYAKPKQVVKLKGAPPEEPTPEPPPRSESSLRREMERDQLAAEMKAAGFDYRALGFSPRDVMKPGSEAAKAWESFQKGNTDKQKDVPTKTEGTSSLLGVENPLSLGTTGTPPKTPPVPENAQLVLGWRGADGKYYGNYYLTDSGEKIPVGETKEDYKRKRTEQLKAGRSSTKKSRFKDGGDTDPPPTYADSLAAYNWGLNRSGLSPDQYLLLDNLGIKINDPVDMTLSNIVSYTGLNESLNRSTDGMDQESKEWLEIYHKRAKDQIDAYRTQNNLVDPVALDAAGKLIFRKPTGKPTPERSAASLAREADRDALKAEMKAAGFDYRALGFSPRDVMKPGSEAAKAWKEFKTNKEVKVIEDKPTLKGVEAPEDLGKTGTPPSTPPTSPDIPKGSQLIRGWTGGDGQTYGSYWLTPDGEQIPIKVDKRFVKQPRFEDGGDTDPPPTQNVTTWNPDQVKAAQRARKIWDTNVSTSGVTPMMISKDDFQNLDEQTQNQILEFVKLKGSEKVNIPYGGAGVRPRPTARMDAEGNYRFLNTGDIDISYFKPDQRGFQSDLSAGFKALKEEANKGEWCIGCYGDYDASNPYLISYGVDGISDYALDEGIDIFNIPSQDPNRSFKGMKGVWGKGTEYIETTHRDKLKRQVEEAKAKKLANMREGGTVKKYKVYKPKYEHGGSHGESLDEITREILALQKFKKEGSRPGATFAEGMVKWTDKDQERLTALIAQRKEVIKKPSVSGTVGAVPEAIRTAKVTTPTKIDYPIESPEVTPRQVIASSTDVSTPIISTQGEVDPNTRRILEEQRQREHEESLKYQYDPRQATVTSTGSPILFDPNDPLKGEAVYVPKPDYVDEFGLHQKGFEIKPSSELTEQDRANIAYADAKVKGTMSHMAHKYKDYVTKVVPGAASGFIDFMTPDALTPKGSLLEKMQSYNPTYAQQYSQDLPFGVTPEDFETAIEMAAPIPFAGGAIKGATKGLNKAGAHFSKNLISKDPNITKMGFGVGRGWSPSGVKQPKPPLVYVKENPVLPELSSEIHWAKWNPETVKNKALMEEYAAIEKAGIPSAAEFPGSPSFRFETKTGMPTEMQRKAQYVQSQSKAFKEFFPEGYEQAWHGSRFDDLRNIDMSKNVRSVHGKGLYMTSNFNEALDMAGIRMKGAIDPVSGRVVNPTVYNIGMRKPDISDLAQARGKGIRQHEIESAIKKYTDPNLPANAEEAAKRYAKVQGKKVEDLHDWEKKMAVDHYGTKETIPEWLKTSEGELSDIMKFKSDYNIWYKSQTPKMKSLLGNVGTFDPKNPNIFKSIAPVIGGAGLAGATLVEYEHGGRHDGEPGKVLTWKDDKDYIQGIADWGIASDVPISTRWSEHIKRQLRTGNYGYNPRTGALIMLPKEQRGTISEADRPYVEDVIASTRRTAEEQAALTKAESDKALAAQRSLNPNRVVIDQFTAGFKGGKPGDVLYLSDSELDDYTKNWITSSDKALQEGFIWNLPGTIATAGTGVLGAAGAVAGSGAGLSQIYQGNTGVGSVMLGASLLPYAGKGVSKVFRPQNIDIADNLVLTSFPRNKYIRSKVTPFEAKDANITDVVRGKSGFVALRKNPDKSYFPTAYMSNPREAGKAFSTLEGRVPEGSLIKNNPTGTYSTDSYSMMLNRAKKTNKYSPEYIEGESVWLNPHGGKSMFDIAMERDLAKHPVLKDMLKEKYTTVGGKRVKSFTSKEEAQKFVDDINKKIDKADFDTRKVKATVEPIPGSFDEFGVKVPNIGLRKSSKGATKSKAKSASQPKTTDPLEPYLGRVVKPPTKEQEILESFLSHDKVKANKAARTTHFDRQGNIIDNPDIKQAGLTWRINPLSYMGAKLPKNVWYRKVGSRKGMQSMVGEQGIVSPSGNPLFFSQGNKPVESYKGIYAVSVDPTKTKAVSNWERLHGPRGQHQGYSPIGSTSTKSVTFEGPMVVEKEYVDEMLGALKQRGKNLDIKNTSVSKVMNPENIEYHGTYAGRPVVEVKMPDGSSEMFYKSTGWAGKKHNQGMWQPYGGHADMSGLPRGSKNWFIKDSQYKDFYGSKTFKGIAEELDNTLAKKFDVPKEDINQMLNFKNIQGEADTFIPGKSDPIHVDIKSKRMSSMANIPIEDPGVEVWRRLPFSNAYTKVDKQKILKGDYSPIMKTMDVTQDVAERIAKIAIYGSAAQGLGNEMFGVTDPESVNYNPTPFGEPVLPWWRVINLQGSEDKESKRHGGTIKNMGYQGDFLR